LNKRKTSAYPAIFAYGFRPFFLLAGIFAVTAILVWIISLHGYGLFGSQRPMHVWHAHEMIFGFVIAAVSGFLLTAIPSWTEQRGFAGVPLIGLTLLWLAGRIVFAFPSGLSALMVAVVDLAFLPVLALTILPALIRSGNRRNLVFIALLFVLFISNLHFHLSAAVVVAPLQLAINVMLIMVAVVGRRTIPVFTSSGLKQRGIDVKIPGKPLLDKSVLVAVCVILLVDIFSPNTTVAAVVAAVTAILMILQLARWQGHRTLQEPILWILHVGYAWLPIALMLKAIWLSGVPIPATSWLHALTTGAFSTMILGVMSRAALGHTGRALIASRAMAVAYLLLTGAALTRVFVPMFLPETWLLWLSLSAGLWIAAFLIFVFVYGPILCRPRVDGRAG
jgi:uncharacterized protein involved in response to NO